MCTGRVDLSFILRAFAKGADGVIISGCWPGECHYVTEGNFDALGTVRLAQKLLAAMGLRPERLRVEWVGASEGTRFAEIMSDFARQVRALGPLGGVEGVDRATLDAKLEAATRLVPYIKLVQREKLTPPSRTEKAIHRFFDGDEANRVFDEMIAGKLVPGPTFAEPAASPCQLACPLGTEAWRYVAHIARGEYEEAYVAIRESNPFPSVCARVCDHKCERHCRLAVAGEDPVAIRALKRFVTDTVDPGVYAPPRAAAVKAQKVAVVGAGPAGLTAAHLLSLRGYRVTVFDANDKPGGMLRLGIPEYRLPRDVLDREIAALLDDNITLQMGVSLGKDITVDGLFEAGFSAVFLSLGSMKSQPLRVNGEEARGVHASLAFLAAFNLRGERLARGRVGVIGGGNSAIDAARIALRQEGVEQVTVLYRRTREEMPAFADEIAAAVDEGVVLATLLSPVSIETAGGALTGLVCSRNELGAPDESGRRRPVPIAGSEHVLPLDTLIVAVGEKPDIEEICLGPSGIEATKWGSIAADPRTLTTSRKGLFAGGDVVTGPNTVVDAIAAGKRAALMIDRTLSGEELRQPGESPGPTRFVEPARGGEKSRLAVPHVPAAERRATFAEVEQVVTEETARREAGRCLRCDLDCRPPAEASSADAVTARPAPGA